MEVLFPIILLVIMYAVLILPQRKRQRAQAELLAGLTPGDEILTTGGIYGGITEIDGNDVYLEVAPDVEIKITRRAVAERVYVAGDAKASAAKTASTGDDDDVAASDEADTTDAPAKSSPFKIRKK
ncbi:MAG: preprotein translocase subunit YajC [Acidimicrobiia bacterium]|nr:preprotein translocase subunit YajC [Acidimicrobiia bacterium]